MNDDQTLPPAEELTDVQGLPDYRALTIDWVGVKGLHYPITVLDRENGTQRTVGSVAMLVQLPGGVKGTHMSRFIEILERHRGEITFRSVRAMLSEMQRLLEAQETLVEVAFPYFVTKLAPVTGSRGLVGYDCQLTGRGGPRERLQLSVKVPVTTLCPCSKEISATGAHNQRGVVTVKVRLTGLLWIEDVVEIVERCASCEVYSVLKRPDEKYVTEKAYRNPVFVEDLVREVALALMARETVTHFVVEAENLESIHDHNAYAYLERTRTEDGGWG
jgi:GTP cyclohydrolase IB